MQQLCLGSDRVLILVVSAGVNGRRLLHGCRKLTMDQCANCGTLVPKVCNFTVTIYEKPETSDQWWAPAQGQARLNVNFETSF